MADGIPPLVFLHSEQGLRAGSKIRYGWYLLSEGAGGAWTAHHSMIGAIGTFPSRERAEAACNAVDADRAHHPGSLRRSSVGL